MAQEKDTTPKKRRDNVVKRALHGRLLSTEFFARNWVSITLLMFMIIGYITNKYQCQTSMETIQRLERELEVVKTERVRERSIYMSRIRESSMQQLVERMHLNLEVQERPPFKIQYEK